MKVHKVTDKIRVEIKTEAEVLQLQLDQVRKPLSEDLGLTGAPLKAYIQTMETKAIEIEARLAELAAAEVPEKRIAFILTPLTAQQKSEVMSNVRVTAGQILEDSMAMSTKAIKYSLKGVEGLENEDGSPYQLVMGKDGLASDTSLDELLNLDEPSQVLMTAALQLAGTGMPDKLRGQRTGQVLEHVVVVKNPKA